MSILSSESRLYLDHRGSQNAEQGIGYQESPSLWRQRGWARLARRGYRRQRPELPAKGFAVSTLQGQVEG